MIGFEAGRELDALVAEKVMGWRWFHFLNKCYLIPPRNTATGFDPANTLRHWDGEGKEGTPDLEWTTLTNYPNFRLRHYSTDIAAAWEVVEKDDGWGFDWTLTRWMASSKPWACVAYRVADGEAFSGMAATAPHAICLAALKAVDK
jgi:hypothetical protein